MSRNTMSFSLPESMREYIDDRVESGGYGNTSEYLRDLIRQDQAAREVEQIRSVIAVGLASGPGRKMTDEVLAEIWERSLHDEP
jgi:antitoxin ParD1/3/4